ncbi:MAG TPA: SCO family protein [Bradyrhizobium sp.]|nr:SCO family protein [Bradyrhizobium sp.]
MHRHHLVLAAVTAVAVIAAGFSVSLVAWLGGVNARVGSGGVGGPFNLVDDRGAAVTETVLAGRPWVIYFGYTFCPEVCPTTLNDLARWMKALGPDADKLNYVFVTVDPARDTPQVMHDYVSAFDPRIRGFTGTPGEIAKVAREYGVYYQRIPTSDGGYVMDHSAALYLMGPDARFVSLIHYQEDDATAVDKLRRLAALAGSS